MARTGSNTSTGTTRARRSTKATDKTVTEPVESNAVAEAIETPTEATPAEVVSTVNTEATEEANPVSTDTVETPVEETVASDTTEATEATATTEVDAEKAAAEKKAEAEYTDFEAAVATALDERDTSTGTVPDAQIESVKEKYRVLNGAKFKNRAKNFLTDKLREAVAGQDIILGTAVMALTDAVQNAGPAPRQAAPARQADPAGAFREKMTVLHLAYALGRAHSPEGVDVDSEMAKVEEKVNELTDAADAYYTWVTNTAEDKGDEPEVDPLVKKAVKASMLKAATATRSAGGSSTPRDPNSPRRNVRTHIAQAFEKLGKGTGDILKVSEIAKTPTEEYPDASCSPGAISAALKSEKGVPGFELASDESGHTAARKL